jgi:hypothetical protein
MKACSSGLSLLRDIIGDMKTDMGDKKIRSVRLTDFVVKMIAFNAIILGGLILAVSYLFFYRQITEVYDDVARAITGEAATQLDNELIKRFVDECDSILSSVDDPLNAYNNDLDSYLNHYKAVPEEEDYINMQRFLEDLRKGTEATEIDFVIMYPEREYGIYVMMPEMWRLFLAVRCLRSLPRILTKRPNCLKAFIPVRNILVYFEQMGCLYMLTSLPGCTHILRQIFRQVRLMTGS